MPNDGARRSGEETRDEREDNVFALVTRDTLVLRTCWPPSWVLVRRTRSLRMRALNLSLRPHRCGSTERLVAASAFKLQCGVTVIPHPEKASRGGEDAYFVCDTALGVADGVGGWAESGVNPADYARGLMDVAKAYYTAEEEEAEEEEAEDAKPEEGNLSSSSGPAGVGDTEDIEDIDDIDDSGTSHATEAGAPPRPSSMEALKRAHAETEKPGSSTACIVQLDLETGALDSSNLGDSGFVVIRDGKVVMKADFQEHYFDCPYQLASLRYVPETDQATDAAVLTGQVEAGDVIVLGSDGLFDNLPMEDILLVAGAVEAQDGDSKAEALASALGEMAFVNSQNPEYESPYALEARRQGYELSFVEKLQAAKFTEGGLKLGQITGGKMDDITVVVGVVVEA